MELNMKQVFIPKGRAMMGEPEPTPVNCINVTAYSDGFWTAYRGEQVDIVCPCGAKCQTKGFGRWTYIKCSKCKFEDFVANGYFLRSPVTARGSSGKNSTFVDVPGGFGSSMFYRTLAG
ncbi:hypothetical protein KJ603_02340 [Patescibacteria group bacterium]|nr:hypothetical protein [Patescibacteria group bacterium]